VSAKIYLRAVALAAREHELENTERAKGWLRSVWQCASGKPHLRTKNLAKRWLNVVVCIARNSQVTP
jgi:hypothetical protein